MSSNATAPVRRSDAPLPAEEHAQAIARFRSYLEVDPANPRLWINMGDLQHQSGEWEAAIGSYETCLRHAPDHPIAQSRLAEVLISQHRFAEAEALLATVLSRATPPDPAVLHNLGLAQYHQGRFAQAEQSLAAAAQGGLRSAQLTGYLVKALHQQGKTDVARQLGARWREMAPTAEVEGYLCLLDFDHGAVDAAYARAAALHARDPGNTDASTVLAHALLDQGDSGGAGALFGNVQRLEPDNPRALLGLGMVAMREEKIGLAREVLEQAYALMPENFGTLVILGWTQIAADDPLAAEGYFRRALELNRGFAETHGGLASALVMQDRREEARTEIKLAKRLGGSFGVGYAESILLGLEQGQAAGSELFTQRLRQLPDPMRSQLQAEIRRLAARPRRPAVAAKP